MLRQVHKQNKTSLYEIECANPHCRFSNLVSEAFYFFAKKDFLSQSKKIDRTTKLPGESNVMFLSMERCGISWIVRRLDRIHHEMFGVPIDYSPEISRVIASRPRFPLPLGWYNVYDLDPELLLKRKYDKVISIQRPRKIMYRVMAMYYMPDLTYEECQEQYPTYFDKIDRYYDMIYEKANEITDERYKNYQLNDFNNYTVDTFHDIMDFLNFPKEERPVLIPVNPPERNWQAYSTTLDKTEPIGAKLRDIQQKYEDGMMEYTIQKKEKHDFRKIDLEHFPPSKHRVKTKKVRVPKINALESKIQNKRKFRLYAGDIQDALEVEETYKILVITPIGTGIGCHLGEKMAQSFRKLGHEVAMISTHDLKGIGLLPSENILISSIIELFLNNMNPDFVFVNEIRAVITNNLELPIFYFHTGWYLRLGVKGKNIINYFRQDQLVEAYNIRNRINKTMYHAVDPEVYYPEPKSIKGVSGIGFRKSWKKWKNIVGSLKPFVEVMELDTNNFIKLGYQYYHTPITDLQYRNLLRKMEALNPLIAYAEYITRRMLEGMACKTLLVYRLDFIVKEDGSRDTSLHRNMLEGMGYYAGEHYIEIKNNKDIERAWGAMTEIMKTEMREKAYGVTLNKHTHINRAKQILADFESGEWRNGEN